MIGNHSHIKSFLPSGSIEHVTSVLAEVSVPFKIEIKKQRKSCYGDYRRYPDGTHKISLNNNLKPEAFLITLLHEVAHLVTFLKYGRKIKPHGAEWKLNYKMLMLPLINDSIFSSKLLSLIANHFKNPKASIDSDHQLSLLLKGELSNSAKKFVFQIENGSIFTLDKKRKFVKEGKKTKRMVCKDLESGKRYLFHPNVEVELVK